MPGSIDVFFFQSKPYGILRLIDEESNINNGTDESMLEKLNHFLKNNEYYEIPQKRELAFIVAHYAGKVKYQITVCLLILKVQSV